MRLPIFQTVLGGLTVKGSIVGTHHDLEEVFELHRRGRTQVERVERELDDVNEAIARGARRQRARAADGLPHAPMSRAARAEQRAHAPRAA